MSENSPHNQDELLDNQMNQAQQLKKLQKTNQIQYIIISLLLIGLFLGAAFWYYDYKIPKADTTSLQNIIKNQYIGNIPTETEYNVGINKGLLSALKDPYSDYLTKEDKTKLNESLNQKYFGVGIYFNTFNKSKITVINVLPNSPASKSGVIEPNDILIEIDGKSVTNFETPELIVSAIKGAENTDVELKFLRNTETYSVKLTRSQIKVDLMTLTFKDETAIVKINSFGEGLNEIMEGFVKKIKDKPEIKRVLIDVTDNGGGLLTSAVDVISYFVPANQVILQEKYKDKSDKIQSTPKNLNLNSYPVAVLVNGNSASASEIVAGALRDIRGAKLIGSKTYGKGVVQQLIPLTNGDNIKLTIAEWLTPNGNQINKKGLEVDIKIDSKVEVLETALKSAF